MRSRLDEKVRAAVKGIQSPSIVLPELVTTVYQDLPSTAEANNSIRVHLKAHVSIPVFTESDFAGALVRWANTDPQGATLTYIPRNGFSVSAINASTTNLGVDAISFSLKGAAEVVWQIDEAAVANALADKDRDAFQGIINGFASVQEARARIEPFWSHKFPNNPKAIVVAVSYPAKSSQ